MRSNPVWSGENTQRNLELSKRSCENPDDGHARYHLGLTCMALEREEEARRAFDLALRGEELTPSLEAMILNMKSYHHLRAGESILAPSMFPRTC